LTQGKKVLQKLKTKPKTIPWKDVVSALLYLGYSMQETKRGSGVKFINKRTKQIISLHKPHPENEICAGARNSVINHLEDAGALND
jgi:hypothetical protein